MAIEVTDNPDRSRYELTLDGERVGLIDYRDAEGTREMFHTEVDEAYTGRGLAGQLVAGAVADARRAGLSVVPTCPYVRAWLMKHPQDMDLVPPAVARDLDML